MNELDLKLGSINEKSADPKFIQIAHRIRELIDAGQLACGDKLPSVNRIIEHFSVSRDTAIKAYQELKNLGIVESSPCKGYFVGNVCRKEGLKRILLLVDELSWYKDKIYQGLVDHLPEGFYVERFCHNDDFDLLKHLYERHCSRPDIAAILIIPTAGQSRDAQYFRFINPGKILFLDRRVPGTPHSAVYQDFTAGLYEALDAERNTLATYRRLVFVTRLSANPVTEDIAQGFTLFCASLGIPFARIRALFTETQIRGTLAFEHGDLIVTLDDLLLAEVLRSCEERAWMPGTDVGLIALNDGPFYSRLRPVPISTLSADFYRMGELAASFVTSGAIEPKRIPARLAVRASLAGHP